NIQSQSEHHALRKEDNIANLSERAAALKVVESIISKVLLPSFVCLNINCHTLWSLLRKFPYDYRYRFYYTWGKLMRQPAYPRLTSVGTESRLKVKGMLKRMTDTSIRET